MIKSKTIHWGQIVMTMTSIKMKRKLEERLNNPNYRTSFNRDNDIFRIERKDTKQGISVKLPGIIAKYNERGEAAVDEIVTHINEALELMGQEVTLTGNEKRIYPVIRSTSFPVETKQGSPLVTKDHTAETRIFYAVDLGKSYRLVEESMLEQENWTAKQLHETALFNIRSLDNPVKSDTVADNTFHFVATQDGYDASRILNDTFLTEMEAKCEGQLVVAVPHQDVLILADIKNDTGYDVLAQMCMQFFAEGRIPITSLALIYEDKTFEPIFILARKKPKE